MILALDTSARNTGVCLGYDDGQTVTSSSSFKSFKNDFGGLAISFRTWLINTITYYKPDIVAFEQPIRPFGNANLITLRQLYGITMIVEMVCQDYDVPCTEVNNGSHKKLLFGKGGKKPQENEAIRLAKLWGFDPQNGDEADACGVYLMTLKETQPEMFEQRQAKHIELLREANEVLI